MNARRGFSLSGDSEELDGYAKATRALVEAKTRVRTLTADNPSQQRRLDELDPLLARRTAELDAALEDRRIHGLEPDREATEARAATLADDELLRRVADLVAEERRLLVDREERTARSVLQTELVEALGAVVSLTLVIAVVVRLRREIGRRVRSEQAVRESEQALKCANDDLERRVGERTAQLTLANGELEAFSHSVVHDLRAPLRGMGSFAEVLLDDHSDALSADARDCLREIHENARKMATLIDALVSMSRIARSDLRRTTVDLAVIARAVARQLADAESRPRLLLGVDENLRAEADPQLARTLLEILLGNSWKFTGKAEAARIELGATNVEGEHVLFVRDNGAGFDMAHRDKLFSPFGRLHTVGEFPGIGIGLAIAQRIVRRHGGRIWADARVGDGASFYFTLSPKSGAGVI
jgi:signal transduction histidine kinase